MEHVVFIYVDMNSYFASVEQQEEPALRGKPVGIITIAKPNAACIAASYEAKRLGLGMGVRMRDALKICPEMAFRPARHDVYVDYHHRIMKAVERVYPIDGIHSVDEFSCRLLGVDCELEKALEISRDIRASITEHVGVAMRCSIGVGSSRLLAKLAGELHKPSGLDWLTPSVLPDKIAHLKLSDIPGIGKNMELRLHNAGIQTVPQLYAMAPKHARKVWNSVNGERFILALQGRDIPNPETRSHSLGHGQILAAINRKPYNAYLVLRRLLIKAATRLRRGGFFAGSIYISVKCAQKGRLKLHWTMAHTQDSFVLLGYLRQMWTQLHPQKPLSLSVMLGGLTALDQSTDDLFDTRTSLGEPTKSEKLCGIVDALNQRHGQDTITFGEKPRSIAPYTGAKIAFNRIPTPEEFFD